MTAAPGVTWDAAEPDLTVWDAMHRGLVRCRPDASLRAVAALMADERVHCVVVIDDPSDTRSLWGVVSDSDLIAAATVRSLDEQHAMGTAIRPAVTIGPYESLARAAQQMTKHGVSHLVVVDPVKDRPLGVISTLDLARALAAAWSPSARNSDEYFAVPDSRLTADSAG
jgi:CBS domain-containing protein